MPKVLSAGQLDKYKCMKYSQMWANKRIWTNNMAKVKNKDYGSMYVYLNVSRYKWKFVINFVSTVQNYPIDIHVCKIS